MKIIKDSVLAGIPVFILKKKISEIKNQYFPKKIEKEQILSNINIETNQIQEEEKEIVTTENSPTSQLKNGNHENNDRNLTFYKDNNCEEKLNKKEVLNNEMKSNNKLKIFF